MAEGRRRADQLREGLARRHPPGRIPEHQRAPDPGLWIYPTSDGEGQGPFRASEKVGQPCWSPDGKTILVSKVSPEGKSETWRVAADGSREERVPIPSTERLVDWSPDGQWVLSFTFGQGPERPFFLMHPDGTGRRPLVPVSNPLPEFGGRLWWSSPRFSPDGRKVLFDHEVYLEGARPSVILSTALLLLDLDGRPIRRFYVKEGEDFSDTFGWSPDGKAIAVLVMEGPAERRIERIKTHVELLDTEGNVLKTINLPLSPYRVIDWR